MPDPTIIGKRLRDLRGDRPRELVALAVGITSQALINYETGMRVPKDAIKAKLAAYYGKTVQELFYD